MTFPAGMAQSTMAERNALPMDVRARTSIAQHTAVAILWRFAGVGVQFLIQTTVMVILARLLTVEDFGLSTQAMIVAGLAAILSECGLAHAVIQRDALGPKTTRVAFTLSVISGVFFASFVWGLAGLGALLLGSPSVGPMLRVISLTFLVGGFGTTSGALLHRRMEFHKVAVIEVVSYTVGYACVSLTLAWFGFGVWSLIYAFVSQACVKTVLLFLISPHEIRPSLARCEVTELMHFGVGTSLTRIANYLAHNGDYFVAGRMLGVLALGYYSRAYQLMNLPLTQISNVLSTVLFSSYSSMRSDGPRISRAYTRSVTVLCMVMFPVFTCLAIIAPELIRGLFGAKWLPTVTSFRILCIAGCLKSMTNAGDSIIRAMGGVYLQARRHAIYACNIALCTYVGSFSGIAGVACGVLVAVTVHYVLISSLSLKLIHLRRSTYFRCHIAGILVSSGIASICLSLAHLLRAIHIHDLFLVGVVVSTIPFIWTVFVLLLPPHLIDEQAADILSQAGYRIRLLRNRLLGVIKSDNATTNGTTTT